MSTQAIAAGENSLAANRSGRMTEEQQRLVAGAVRHETSQGLIGVGGLTVLVLFIVLASLGSSTANVDPSGYAFFDALLALGLLIMGILFWRRSRLLREVQAGELERATGHVDWKGGRYRAQVPGRSLDLTAFNLGTGTYDFSYLPRSGRLVSAELAAADTPIQAQDELRHALAVTNHFNVDDYSAYREGKIGRSEWRLLRRTWSTTGWLLLSAFVLLVIFVALVNTEASQDLAPMAIVFAVFLALGALGSALGAFSPTLDVLGGRVATAEGTMLKLTRTTSGRGAHTIFYYVLDDQRWIVTPEAYRALLEGPGHRYRVYYLLRSKKLVGIEPGRDEG